MIITSSILAWLFALPALGAIAVLALPSVHARRPWIGARAVAAAFAIATLICAGRAAGEMATGGDGSVLTWRAHGVGLRIDATSASLMLLVAGMGLVVVWGSYAINREVKAYFALVQFFMAAALGALMAADLLALCGFLFAAIAGLYGLLSRWGSDVATARRFLTLCGSGVVCALAGLWMCLRAGMVQDWLALGVPSAGHAWGFWLVVAGLGSLAGLVPVHFWLPSALADARTPVAMLVAGVLQTLAGYAMWRCLPLLSLEMDAHRVVLGVLGVCSLAYGALAALGEKQLKRIAAYISTALMGVFFLGLAAGTPAATVGAMHLLYGHALAMGMLLFVAGMLEDRTGHSNLMALGGLSGHMPGFAGWSALGMLGAAGLPGLCVFGGELLVIIGAFQRGRALGDAGGGGGGAAPDFVWVAVICAAAVLLLLAGAVWTYQHIFLGTPRAEHSNLAPMSVSERWILVVLGGASVISGLVPGWGRW